MPSTQKDNRSDVPQPLIPLRESAAGEGGRGQERPGVDAAAARKEGRETAMRERAATGIKARSRV